MRPFLSTYTNKVDAKGRISIPARFRQVVADGDFPGVVIFPSFTAPCLEGVTMQRMEELAEMIDAEFEPFDETYGAFAHSILADSYELTFDGEGRVLFPEELLEHAHIGDFATFVGLGKRFQMWEPSIYARKRETARGLASERRALLHSKTRRKPVPPVEEGE
jgi:MraZ protein